MSHQCTVRGFEDGFVVEDLVLLHLVQMVGHVIHAALLNTILVRLLLVLLIKSGNSAFEGSHDSARNIPSQPFD